MLRYLVALLLAVLGQSALAQDWAYRDTPDCVPKTFWTPFGTGTDWVRGATTASGVTVSWRGWWCPRPEGQWRFFLHRCVEGVTCLSAQVIEQEMDAAARTPDKLQALKVVIAKYQSAPEAPHQEAWLQAGFAAVDALRTVQPAGPVVAIWLVTGAQAFPLNADGTRSTKPIATAPTKGETCDCAAARVLQFGATFCKVPSLSTTQTIVAGCSLKKP